MKKIFLALLLTSISALAQIEFSGGGISIPTPLRVTVDGTNVVQNSNTNALWVQNNATNSLFVTNTATTPIYTTNTASTNVLAVVTNTSATPLYVTNLYTNVLAVITNTQTGAIFITNTQGAALWITNTSNFGDVVVTNIFTRTNDYTTAYSANDCIAPSTTATNLPIELLSIIPNGSGRITKIRCATDSATPIGTFRFWFYHGTNVTGQADNTPYTVRWTNAPTRIGWVDVVMQAGTDCSYGLRDDASLRVNAPTGTSLFYAIQTLTGFTPTGFTNILSEITVSPSK